MSRARFAAAAAFALALAASWWLIHADLRPHDAPIPSRPKPAADPSSDTVMYSERRPTAEELDREIEVLDQRAAANPGDPVVHMELGSGECTRLGRGSLTSAERRRHIEKGLRAVEWALALNPQFMEAMLCRACLLNEATKIQPDPATRARLLAEAFRARDRGVAIARSRMAVGLPAQTYFDPQDFLK